MIDSKFCNGEFAKNRNNWLKEVSRTFYPSIKVLPSDLCCYVGHSYLLCRLLDTIEDAYDIPAEEKKDILNKAIECIKDPMKFDRSNDVFSALADKSDIKEYEKIILRNSFHIFECIETFPENVRKSIRTWTVEMAEGMKKYSFGTDNPKVQLSTMSELEEYTYYVAGTVGKLLSELYTDAKYKIPKEKIELMEKNSIAFGKALQYVNIIKDSRMDFKEGRCFIPKDILDKYSCSFEEFKDSGNTEKIRKIYLELIIKAEEYLDNSVEYTGAIPVRLWRIRLFCIWPVTLAYKTLTGLKNNLDDFIKDNSTYKISRTEVKSVLKNGYIAAFSNWYFKKMIKKNKIYNIDLLPLIH
ncbi:MAG: squalene/phytoene synthase family protein [Candidatus Delongbacteria bacterium]|nr:squalene/phytoene synthase family protein [Candidatus Delongbacteria bacterium]MCG2760279.1 squalene/phytoene synthase family protein [Candidatus Delongbacteria bacterium]